MEMVINGVSTRKVCQITEELCGTSFSNGLGVVQGAGSRGVGVETAGTQR